MAEQLQRQVEKGDFYDKLEVKATKDKFLCIGLDTDYNKIPEYIRKKYKNVGDAIFEFNKGIVEATYDIVSAYKPNLAFYLRYGDEGMKALKKTFDYIAEMHPGIVRILDCKSADIGNTNEGYADGYFNVDQLNVDAITSPPLLGKEAIEPFLKKTNKGLIVLAKTSNPGSGEFQDLPTGLAQEPLYKVIAGNVASNWNYNSNCGLVVGATYPRQMREIRATVGDRLPILIPGVGKSQGGDVIAAVSTGKTLTDRGIIINSSRDIIYAYLKEESDGTNYADAARNAALEFNKQIVDNIHIKNNTQKLLDGIFDTQMFKFGNYDLKLHKDFPDAPKSPVYIDLRGLRGDVDTRRIALDVYKELLESIKKKDFIADIPTSATPLVAILAQELGFRMVTPRMDQKEYGTGAKIDGAMPGDKELGLCGPILDDLITNSNSKLEGIRILENGGYRSSDVVVLFDRGQGGKEELRKKGIQLHAAVRLDDALKYYLHQGNISPEVYLDTCARIAQLNTYLKK